MVTGSDNGCSIRIILCLLWVSRHLCRLPLWLKERAWCSITVSGISLPGFGFNLGEGNDHVFCNLILFSCNYENTTPRPVWSLRTDWMVLSESDGCYWIQWLITSFIATVPEELRDQKSHQYENFHRRTRYVHLNSGQVSSTRYKFQFPSSTDFHIEL